MCFIELAAVTKGHSDTLLRISRIQLADYSVPFLRRLIAPSFPSTTPPHSALGCTRAERGSPRILDSAEATVRNSHKCSLAIAVLAAFGTSLSADLFADSVIVDNCGDSDDPSGISLRQAIALANNGDVVDLSGLGCSTITLAQGELTVEQNILELRGPFDGGLTIDAHAYSRAINHVGTGTLFITDLGVAYGVVGAVESGGCIHSYANVELLRSTISHCMAGNRGGAAYANNLHVVDTRIYDNSANTGGGLAGSEILIEHGAVTGNHAGIRGGGASATYKITINDSIITGNTSDGRGGAVSGDYKMYLARTSVSGNAAAGYGGGLYHSPSKVGARLLQIADSTIDNNVSGYRGGGVYGGYHVEIVGSTISSNISGSGSKIFSGQGAGIFCYHLSMKNSTVVLNRDLRPGGATGGVQAKDATIISSIVANNVGYPHGDLYVAAGGLTAYTSLIRVSSEPSVSLTVDPRLGPLADHGGGRRTHAVLPGSPVIDVGSNPLSLQNDERGLPRVVGLKPDIGAYERQADDDQLWYDGFDSS